MTAVIAASVVLGHRPREASTERIGYDIESRENGTGRLRLRLIKVKSRAEGADTVTVMRNETLTALDKSDAFILAAVAVVNGLPV